MKRNIRFVLALAAASAATGCDVDGVLAEPSDATCDYPSGAREPMEAGQVISPYRWSAMVDADGSRGDLDLHRVYCDEDTQIDWSPFDALAFISIPAW